MMQFDDPPYIAPSRAGATPSFSLVVPDEAAGQPLASLLAAHLDRADLAHLFARGGVWLGRARVQDAAHPAPPGEQVTVCTPPDGHYQEIAIEAADICYEDDWLLALNKRAGWYTAPTPWDAHAHVQVALLHFLQQRDGGTPYIRPVHQLDRDTSGVLLCTRSPHLNGTLQNIFTSGELYKAYVGICVGELATETETFEVRSGHGRGRSGLWRLYDLEQVGMELPNGKRVKFAHTSFTVQQRMPGATLVHALLHTGRTHQIRLHLASLGHPILGDTRYGGPPEYSGQALERHLLHAGTMRLPHPVTGEPLEVRAPLPEHIAAVLRQ